MYISLSLFIIWFKLTSMLGSKWNILFDFFFKLWDPVSNRLCKVDENIIGAPKMRNDIWCTIKLLIFKEVRYHFLKGLFYSSIAIAILLTKYLFSQIFGAFCCTNIIFPRGIYVKVVFTATPKSNIVI